MMRMCLTRARLGPEAARFLILVVAAIGVLIPLSNLMLPLGSVFQGRLWWRCSASMLLRIWQLSIT